MINVFINSIDNFYLTKLSFHEFYLTKLASLFIYCKFYIKLFIIELRACKKEREQENLKSHTMMLNVGSYG